MFYHPHKPEYECGKKDMNKKMESLPNNFTRHSEGTGPGSCVGGPKIPPNNPKNSKKAP